jgi:tetratricopeptide (TPR) repeat protein
MAVGNFAQLLIGKKEFKRAMPMCKKVHEAAPLNEVYVLNYVNCLAELDSYVDAIGVLKDYIDKSKSAGIQVYLALASVYRACLQAEKSILVLEVAKEKFPDNPECDRAIAEAYAELNPELASKAFEKAVLTSKKQVALKWNWSFVELRLGNFGLGWELYETGLNQAVGKAGRPLPAVMKQFPMITTFDEIDVDKYTILSAEQGIGDQILFLSCIEDMLKKSNNNKIILIAEDRMQKLLKRSFPSIEVRTFGFANSLLRQQHRLNGVFPIGSLMKLYRQNEGCFVAAKRKYIEVNEGLANKYRNGLIEKVKRNNLIGLSWSGGHWDRQKKTKSMTFEEIMSVVPYKEDTQFLCLQYGDVSKERQLAKEKKWPITFIDGIDFKKDIDAWTALASACDRIISVSTALVHFAGASGMRVDVILGNAQSPFIWGLNEGQSLPYLNVNLLRQGKQEVRNDYLERLKKAL